MVSILMLACMLKDTSSSYLCVGCSKPYYFSYDIDVGACPTGYIDLSYTCTASSSVRLLKVDFSLYSSLDISTVDIFSVPSGTFRTIGNPFPTLDRGFYFPPGSYLQTTSNLIPSPETTMEFWVKILSSGDIISVTGDEPFLVIGGKDFFYFNYRYCGIDLLCNMVNQVNSFDTLTVTSSWKYLTVDLKNVYLTQFDTVFNLNANEEQLTTLEGENAISVKNNLEKYTWQIGKSSGGFQGFIYMFNVLNEYQTYWEKLVSPSVCEPYQYEEDGNCFSCSSCTSTGTWCLRSGDCSPCPTDSCQSCTGYSDSECTSFTVQCSEGCLKCTNYLNCLTCRRGYLKLGYSWGSICSENMKVSLLSSQLSSFVIFGDPDGNGMVPKPFPGRGFYFDVNQYLTTRSNFLLPGEFFIYMWVFVIDNGRLFRKGDSIDVDTYEAKLKVKKFNGEIEYFFKNYVVSTSGWKYFEVEGYFDEESFFFQVCSNSCSDFQTDSYKSQYILSDSINEVLKIGDGFKGFISIFGIASKVINSSLYSIGYLQTFTTIYGNILNTCYYSNNLLHDLTCTVCDYCLDYINSDCYQCEWGYFSSYSSYNSISPSPGYVEVDGTSFTVKGLCLFTAKGLGCSECYLSLFLYKNICIKNCPTGYSVVSNECTLSTSNIFSMNFLYMLNSSSYQNVKFGADTTSAFPSLDINDPLPVHGRGYYFTSSKYLKVTDLVFGPEISIGIWVYIINDGDIYYKKNDQSNDNFKLNRNTKMYFNVISAYSNYYIENPDALALNSWNFIENKISFEPGEYLTTMNLVYNSFYSKILSFENDFLEENLNIPLVLGSDKGFGFTGFIYLIEIFSDPYHLTDSLNSLSCGVSPLSSNCLETCSLTSYFSSNSCQSCLSSCSISCLRSVDCFLCESPLCELCEMMNSSKCIQCTTNSFLNTSELCECDVTFYLDSSLNQCLSCSLNCDSCVGGASSDCVKCSSGYKYFPVYTLCIPSDYCPGISSAVSDSCEMIDVQMIFVRFDSFFNDFYDEKGGIDFHAGSNSMFYPNYENDDPWIIPGRGYYFNVNSFLAFDSNNQVVLAPEITIGIWAKVESLGGLLIIQDITTVLSLEVTNCVTGISSFNCLQAQVRDFNGNIQNSFSGSFGLGIWVLFEFFLARVDQTRVNPHSNLPFISLFHEMDGFKDSISSLRTSKIGGFSGFIYSFEVYNYWHPLTINLAEGPSDLSDILPNCSFFQYLPSCLNCGTNCLNGCSNPDTCTICNDPLCLKCSSFNTCLECFGSAVLVGGICTCSSGFNYTQLTCIEVFSCHDSCLTCSGNSSYDCVECKDGLFKFKGFCVGCPSGSSVEVCETYEGPSFYTNFSQNLGVWNDQVAGIQIICGNSYEFYPSYDVQDPFVSYLRGFYFNGESSVVNIAPFGKWIQRNLTLPINWTVHSWINTKSLKSCYFSMSLPEYDLLNFCLDNGTVKIFKNDTLGNISETLFLTEKLFTSWLKITIFYKFSSISTFELYLNDEFYDLSSNSLYFTPNHYNSRSFTIGKSSQFFFKGFIYEFSIFSGKFNTERQIIIPDFCEYPYNGSCLIDCEIDEYWVGPSYNNCSPCLPSCSQGCRRNDSCSLCNDPLCSLCQDFDDPVCESCSSGSDTSFEGECSCKADLVLDYAIQQCRNCESYQYYDNFTCTTCPQLCLRCKSGSECLECVENANLKDQKCFCELGFNGTNSCVKAFFEAKLLTSNGNSVYLHFEDQLLKDLTLDSLEVSLSSGKIKEISIKKWTNLRFLLDFKSSELIKTDTKITVNFTKPLYSIYNSQLLTTSLTESLYSEEKITSIQKQKEAKATSETVTMTYTSTSIGLSMANPNPASLWSFINTIQMLCFMAMSSIELPPKFLGYLEGLKKYNMFPNIFIYFVPRTGGVKPFEKAFKFGYKDHLILFNIGSYISAFLSMIAMFLITLLSSKLTRFKPFSIPFIKGKIMNSLANYKYGAFVRFWITSYLDVFAAALVGILTTPSFFWVEAINFIVCFLVAGIVVATPIVFFVFTYKKREEISNENQEVQANWGTLFYEFNNDKGLGSSQFYFFFFTRRIAYMIIQFFLQDVPIVQLSLNLVLSGCNFVYLAFFRPFGEKILNLSNAISELGITLIFVFCAINLLNIPSGFKETIDDLLVGLINAIMATQMLGSLSIFVKTIYLILKQKCVRKTLVVPGVTTTIEAINPKLFR